MRDACDVSSLPYMSPSLTGQYLTSYMKTFRSCTILQFNIDAESEEVFHRPRMGDQHRYRKSHRKHNIVPDIVGLRVWPFSVSVRKETGYETNMSPSSYTTCMSQFISIPLNWHPSGNVTECTFTPFHLNRLSRGYLKQLPHSVHGYYKPKIM